MKIASRFVLAALAGLFVVNFAAPVLAQDFRQRRGHPPVHHPGAEGIPRRDQRLGPEKPDGVLQGLHDCGRPGSLSGLVHRFHETAAWLVSSIECPPPPDIRDARRATPERHIGSCRCPAIPLWAPADPVEFDRATLSPGYHDEPDTEVATCAARIARAGHDRTRRPPSRRRNPTSSSSWATTSATGTSAPTTAA